MLVLPGVTHTVTFVDWDGTVLSTQTVGEGQAATAPADPYREGYNFIGWDADFANVTSDLTITALYELIYEPPTFPDTPIYAFCMIDLEEFVTKTFTNEWVTFNANDPGSVTAISSDPYACAGAYAYGSVYGVTNASCRTDY